MVQTSGEKTTWDGDKNPVNNLINYLSLNWCKISEPSTVWACIYQSISFSWICEWNPSHEKFASRNLLYDIYPPCCSSILLRTKFHILYNEAAPTWVRWKKSQPSPLNRWDIFSSNSWSLCSSFIGWFMNLWEFYLDLEGVGNDLIWIEWYGLNQFRLGFRADVEAYMTYMDFKWPWNGLYQWEFWRLIATHAEFS